MIFLFVLCQSLPISTKHYFTLYKFLLNLLCWDCLTVPSSSSYLSEILASVPLFILCSNHCYFSLCTFSYAVYSWLNKLYQSQNHNRSDLKTYWMNTFHSPVVYEYNALSFLFFSVVALLPGDCASHNESIWLLSFFLLPEN